ncbi:DUF4340 domain-containing protein [Phycisphaeraceae bacterium D3-23]
MNLRTTLVLLIVLLAVGAGWWLTRSLPDTPAPSTQTDDGPTPIFPADVLKPQRIDRIEITQPGRPDVVLEQVRGRWRMTEPIAFEADAKTINQLIATLAAFADLGPAQGAAVDGSDAIAQLVLTGSDTTHTVFLGPRVGGGMGSILRGNQSPRLVADTLHGFFERYDPTDLLSKQLATPTAYGTTRFTVTTPQATTHLEQIDDQWYIDGDTAQPALNHPVAGYADIAGYLNIPSATPIERFVVQPGADLSPYGLRRPSVRIDYETPGLDGETDTSTLLIGSPTDAQRTSYFATYFHEGETRPVVFVLPAEFSIVMAKSADDFRDPRLFTTPPLEIERIEVRGEENWAINLTDERGSIITPSRSISGDAALLRERVTALVTANAKGYMDPAEVDAEPYPPVTISVVPTLGRPAERVTFYYWDSTPQLANEAGEQHVIAIRESETRGMLIPWIAFEQLGDLEVKEALIERDGNS